ncbi:hypothetical protein MKW92_003320, partial [Papaver armeniacum]
METASPNSRSKDRISNLPDEILHKILSHLDISEVVRTSELSKRWRYTWKSVPSLNLTSCTWNRYPGKDKFLGFLNFVDRVLICRDNTSINRFSLDVPNYYKAKDSMMESINTWIYALLQRNIQEIFLQLNNVRSLDFDFPKEFFHCKSLKKLELVMTNKVLTWIYFPESMCLPQLKSLCLRLITIPNIDSANELFTSCPGLETLVLSNIDVHVEDENQNFVINNALLQHLEIKNIWYLKFFEDSIVNPKPIQLDVPSLTKFIYEDSMVRENCCFINDSSSLVTADIVMILNDTYDENDVNEHGDKVDEDLVLYSNVSEAKREEFSKRVLKFLRALHCVKELKLSPGFFEVLSGSPLLDNSPLKFDNLRCLKMELWLTRRCLDVIIHLLKISPNIESIYIISKK